MIYILKITSSFYSHTQDYKNPTKVDDCQKLKIYDHLLNFIHMISLQLYAPILDETTNSPCKTWTTTMMMMVTTRAMVVVMMMMMMMIMIMTMMMVMTTIIIHI